MLERDLARSPSRISLSIQADTLQMKALFQSQLANVPEALSLEVLLTTVSGELNEDPRFQLS